MGACCGPLSRPHNRSVAFCVAVLVELRRWQVAAVSSVAASSDVVISNSTDATVSQPEGIAAVLHRLIEPEVNPQRERGDQIRQPQLRPTHRCGRPRHLPRSLDAPLSSSSNDSSIS
jgi:hypothetical protein